MVYWLLDPDPDPDFDQSIEWTGASMNNACPTEREVGIGILHYPTSR
jgi:hypothetical protein